MKTLDYIEEEATNIAASWNGSDERFGYGGVTYTENDVHLANELLEKLSDIRALISSLDI